MNIPQDSSKDNQTVPFTLSELIKYFLWLGITAFGGAIANIGYIQRDLVENKRWFTHKDYLHALAMAQMCPGPLASQVAMYLGWLKCGAKGAGLVALAWIVPSFLLVSILALFYMNYGNLPWMQGAFYGIGASIIAILVRSSFKLVKMVIERNFLLGLICLINTIITLYFQTPSLGLITLSGLVFMLFTSPPKFLIKLLQRLKNKSTPPSLLLFPSWLVTGLSGPAPDSLLLKLMGLFTWAGAFIFGSGLAIIPFLHKGVVEDNNWLTHQQFMDAIAIGFITPGPGLLSVTFIGFLIAGFIGASIATVGIFFPGYVFVITIAPHYRKIIQNHSAQTFVKGITAAISGAIIASVLILSQKSIVDAYTVAIFLVSCVLIFWVKKIPDPLVIISAGLVGIMLK